MSPKDPACSVKHRLIPGSCSTAHGRNSCLFSNKYEANVYNYTRVKKNYTYWANNYEATHGTIYGQ